MRRLKEELLVLGVISLLLVAFEVSRGCDAIGRLDGGCRCAPPQFPKQIMQS